MGNCLVFPHLHKTNIKFRHRLTCRTVVFFFFFANLLSLAVLLAVTLLVISFGIKWYWLELGLFTSSQNSLLPPARVIVPFLSC